MQKILIKTQISISKKSTITNWFDNKKYKKDKLVLSKNCLSFFQDINQCLKKPI